MKSAVDGLRRRARSHLGGALGALFVAVVLVGVGAPVVAIAWTLRSPDRALWELLARTTLPRMLVTTTGMAVAVAGGTALLGSALAWLVTTTSFPGRSVVRWLLVVPMVIPSYVVAFVYVGLLQFAGPVQTQWRDWFGAEAWFPPVRTPVSATLVFILTLYPYVYVPALAVFSSRGGAAASAARTLGRTSWGVWWSVALPMARPAIAAGAGLAAMETVADIGVTRAFSVASVGDGVLRVWFGLDNRVGAGQLAMSMLGIVVTLLMAERLTRRRGASTQRSTSTTPMPVTAARGWRGWRATIACASVIAVGAAVPIATLVGWSVRAHRDGLEGRLDRTFAGLASTTAIIAAATAVACAACGAIIAFASWRPTGRRGSARSARWAAVTSLGYAVPGLLLGAGALSVLAEGDRRLDALARWDDRFYVSFLLVGSMAGLVYALTVRFLAVSKENVQAGLERVDERLLSASDTLGANRLRRFLRVEFPLARSSLVVAALLVAIDALKELPVTLLLRPAGRDTLAVFVWNMTNESRWEEASTAALALVVAGLPLLLVVVSRLGRMPRDA
jgi:iron(III) transport system permease protein